ncbi:MAG: DUF6572 domain-containing protein [Zavarzinella sp.]
MRAIIALLRIFWNVITLKETGLANPNHIDIVAEDIAAKKLVLIMTEHRKWDGDNMRRQFLEKVKAYTNYVLSNKFADDWKKYRISDVIFKLDSAHKPDNETISLFDKVNADLSEHGIEFCYEVC